MTVIGKNCHELRVKDANKEWRIFYQVDNDAVLILEVCNKTTRQTPNWVLDTCKTRLTIYDQAVKNASKGKKS